MTQAEFLFSKGKQTPATPGPRIYTITQLTRLIKLTLNEQMDGSFLTEGEISNFTRHSSGHLYLTLRDDHAQIPAVMWRGPAGKLKFKPGDGMAVVAKGRVDVYEPQGKYQFYIDKLEPAGVGALELAFRQLAEKLKSEGLFDSAQKKSLPAYPETISIITSLTGAAIEDIKKTLSRRYPMVRKLLFPVAVQGERAAGEIARAIRQINRRQEEWGGVDVIIVARGGGGIEDLWAFNEEEVGRAIFASQIPIITGIGHEIDVTIADMVADVRAATPTAAAQQATPLRDDLLERLAQWRRQLYQGVARHQEQCARALSSLASRPMFARSLDIIRFQQQNLDEQGATLKQQMTAWLRRAERTLESRAASLRKIEPQAALSQARTRLVKHFGRLQGTMRVVVEKQKHELANMEVTLYGTTPRRRTEQGQLQVHHFRERLEYGRRLLLARRAEQLAALKKRLRSLNPRSVLARGYSITRRKTSGLILTPQTLPAVGEDLITQLADQLQVESKVNKPPRSRKGKP